MSIAAAVFITAVGAILRYAVNDNIQGIDLQTVGLILMIAGIVGLAISLIVEFTGRRRVTRYNDRDLPPRY